MLLIILVALYCWKKCLLGYNVTLACRCLFVDKRNWDFFKFLLVVWCCYLFIFFFVSSLNPIAGGRLWNYYRQELPVVWQTHLFCALFSSLTIDKNLFFFTEFIYTYIVTDYVFNISFPHIESINSVCISQFRASGGTVAISDKSVSSSFLAQLVVAVRKGGLNKKSRLRFLVVPLNKF